MQKPILYCHRIHIAIVIYNNKKWGPCQEFILRGRLRSGLAKKNNVIFFFKARTKLKYNLKCPSRSDHNAK